MSRHPVAGQSRRRFIRKAIYGASALVVASTVRPRNGWADQEPQPAFVATELNHLSLDITRFSRSEEFYQSVFGLTPVEHGGRGGDKFMHFEQGFLNMRPSDRAGMNHFCFSIQDYDSNYAFHMLEFAETRPFRMGGRNLHCFDPDGLNVQVQEERHGWGRVRSSQLVNADNGKFRTVRIHHIELNVTDIAKSRAFYTQMFGLKVLAGADSEERCLMSVGESAYLVLSKSENAGMGHYCYAVEGFDANHLPDELAKLTQGEIEFPEAGIARFADPQGILIEVTSPGHKLSLA